MGLTITSFYKRLFNPTTKKQQCILMLGLDNAGKTTILYKLKFAKSTIAIVPTVGFNVEIINYKNINFLIWDISGKYDIQRYFYQKIDGIIFVIDSNDTNRLGEVKNELQILLEEYELRDAVLLILANKQDLSTSMTIEKIQEILQLDQLTYRKWHLQATSALKNIGLSEGFKWLSKELS